jgi:hypothetical protein
MLESLNTCDGWEKIDRSYTKICWWYDLCSWCTLDQFTQDYIEKKVVERVKGFFPYEAITTDNL